MKPIAGMVAVMAIILMSTLAAAEQTEKTEIALSIPPDFYAQVCASPVWKGVTAVWKGVTDERADKVVGLQTKKGQEPVELTANPALANTFDAALRDLFTKCGMKFVDHGDAATTKISAEVKDFYVGVEKKIITGKAKAKSMLNFLIDQGVKSTTVDVGMDMESKEARKGDIKALTKALNNLFAETLKQVATTQQLREIK